MTQTISNHSPEKKPGQYLLLQLKQIHNHLRHDLSICQALAKQVADGAPPEHIRQQIQALQTNSQLWKLRTNCLYYCQHVHLHHYMEDIALFPAVRRERPELAAVVDKLESDHHKVSNLLDSIEANANALAEQDGVTLRTSLVDALNDLSVDLLTHLDFEEKALEPVILEWKQWPH